MNPKFIQNELAKIIALTWPHRRMPSEEFLHGSILENTITLYLLFEHIRV
jgi:hypothetical protein